MKLRFTPRALENISDVAEYLQARNPTAAERARSAIYDGVQNLILFRHIGRLQHVAGVRRLVTKKFSYLIYYAVDEAAEEIVILNVKHASQEREYSDL
jgi:plasmid stabilization system protein ParE